MLLSSFFLSLTGKFRHFHSFKYHLCADNFQSPNTNVKKAEFVCVFVTALINLCYLSANLSSRL